MVPSRLFWGPVAQLGERHVRNVEVEGSIPFRSKSASVPSSPLMVDRIQKANRNRYLGAEACNVHGSYIRKPFFLRALRSC